MTFVGKILVIVILVFSVIFLSLTVVSFSTTENWKDATAKAQAEVKKLQGELGDATTIAATREQELQKAQADHKNAIDQLGVQINDLDAQKTQLQTELDDQRTKLATALQTMKSAQEEAQARASESDELRTLLAAVQKQANEFKDRQRDLNDQIFELKRFNEDVSTKNTQLRERLASALGQLRRVGASETATVSTAGATSVEPPPTLRGEVTRVNDQNSLIEISVGSDDGLTAGHRLQVYRTTPRPEYLGEIEILSTDPDQAAARVISRYQGKQIQEGDNVAPTIRPRG